MGRPAGNWARDLPLLRGGAGVSRTYAVVAGPLSGRIFAGPLSKDGTTLVRKADVTEQAISAVVGHIRHTHGSEATLRVRGLTITINIKETQE